MTIPFPKFKSSVVRRRTGWYVILACVPQCSIAFAIGYHVEAAYTADILRNVSGGVATGTAYVDNLDFTLEIDVSDARGVGSGTFFVYGLYNNSATFSDRVIGDLQVTSNIDTGYGWRLYEFWYEYNSGSWSVRSGLYDLNSEFDVNRAGSLFLNSSHGIGPDFSQTGRNGPSIFPVTSLGVRYAAQIHDLTGRIVVLDGVPGDPQDPSSNEISLGGQDGVLVVAEIEVPLRGGNRVWTGYWRYSADFERSNDSGSANNNDGWYVGAENRIDVGQRGVTWFVRYGQANEHLNAIRRYMGAGIVVRAPIPSRLNDDVGIAIASARLGDPYRYGISSNDIPAQRHETNWELTYRAQINENLAIQPNIQFVQNPSALGALDDAWILGLRFEILY